jgi:hypothetical protein
MKSTNAKFSGSIILLSIINEAEFIFYVLIHTLYSSNLIPGKKFAYFFKINKPNVNPIRSRPEFMSLTIVKTW